MRYSGASGIAAPVWNTSHCYNADMDITIRNLDVQLYRRLKARAALTGKTVGEAVNEAMRVYLAHPPSEEGFRIQESGGDLRRTFVRNHLRITAP